MTTRRTVLRLAGAVPAAALLAACQPEMPHPTAIIPDASGRLLVRTADGLAVVDTVDGRVLVSSAAGVSAWDGSAIVSAAPASGGTRIEVRDLSGAMSYGTAVDGAFNPRVVSPGTRYVALASGSAAGSTPYRPTGRAETTIVVAGPGGERYRHTIPGCVEPEAFTPQADGLFVLDYLPPGQPDRYRVRLVELATGNLQPLLTRDKQLVPIGAEEEMRGEGRQAVYSHGLGTLFTLYTHQPDHLHTRDLVAGGARDSAPHVHAFVHSLMLEARWAFCIDLPAPFGEGGAEGHAIALSPGTDDPYVIDANSGTIARLDSTGLSVEKTAKVLPTSTAAACAVFSPDGAKLFIGTGTAVHAVRPGELSVDSQWTVPEPVRGLALTHGGARLWAGQKDAVVALDAATGRQLARVAVPGLAAVEPVAS